MYTRVREREREKEKLASAKVIRRVARLYPSAGHSLTDEPRVPPIVLDGQVEKVLFETLNGVRLRLDRQSALDFRLVTVTH